MIQTEQEAGPSALVECIQEGAAGAIAAVKSVREHDPPLAQDTV